MNRETEFEVRAIIRKHLNAAIDEITESDPVDLAVWWAPGHAERLAEQVTQSIALMAESFEEAEANGVTTFA